MHKIRGLLRGVTGRAGKEIRGCVDTIYEELLDKELECNDLRLEVLNQRGRVEEVRALVSEEKMAPLIAKWERFDDTLLKTAIMKDGAIRDIDEVEYERMRDLVDKMKPKKTSEVAVVPSCSKAMNSSTVKGAEDIVLGKRQVPVHVTASQVMVKKQCKLTFYQSPDGKRRLGFEFPRNTTDDGFFSGSKRKK